MITNIADVLRILETDYKIISVKDTVKVRVLFEEGNKEALNSCIEKYSSFGLDKRSNKGEL